MPSKPPSPHYRSMLRDGWWIGLTALLIITVGTIWQVSQSLSRERLLGDSVNPETYGFDLSELTVPRENLSAYARRDEIPALTDPEVLTVADVERINREEHGKYLVPTDRVIGVMWWGQARAYPLRLMAVHEVVNDRLGSDKRFTCIAYNGMADTAQVFWSSMDEFRSSGLVYNGVPLLYDLAAPGSEGFGYGNRLWSLLLNQIVTGPYVPFEHSDSPNEYVSWGSQVMQWRDWLALYPSTTVLAPIPEHNESYRSNPYGSYWQTEEMWFPVAPLPDKELSEKHGLRLKSRVMGFLGAVLPYESVLREASYDETGLGTWTGWVEELGQELRFRCRKPDVGFAPETVWLSGVNDTFEPFVPCTFWFAWYSHHPDTIVIDLPANGTPRPPGR